MNAFAGQSETPASSPFVSATRHSQVLRRRAGAERRVSVDRARRGAWPRRRERRGQVDADPRARRSDPTRRRRHCRRRQRTDVSTPHIANDLGMSFIHQELAFVPGMTVLQNIMLGLPKKTRFGIVDWRRIARDVEPIARRVGVSAPLDANVKRPVDGRELADQHYAGADSQGAADRDGRTDGCACPRRRAKSCSRSSAISASPASRCSTSRIGSTKFWSFAKRVTVFRDGQLGRRTRRRRARRGSGWSGRSSAAQSRRRKGKRPRIWMARSCFPCAGSPARRKCAKSASI